MSRIAKVLAKNKTMNHFLWPFLAAFHMANPFHGKDHSATSNINMDAMFSLYIILN